MCTTASTKSDRLTAAYVKSGEEAVVYFDGEPTLFLKWSAYWCCDHIIVGAERMPPITHDCLDAITFLKEHTLTGFLDKVWDALKSNENDLMNRSC